MSSLLEHAVSVGPAPRAPTRRLSLTAFIEERFLVPAYSTRAAPLWIAGHRTLALPLQLRGAVRNYTARLDGADVRIVGVGDPKRFKPLFRQLFGEVQPAQEAPAGPRLTCYPGGLDGLEADLVVCEVHRWFAPAFRARGWKLMPDSVRWAAEAVALPPAKPCRSLREDLKKLRRYQYALEQTTAWSDWEEFYETMLAPQAVRRFGETAWLPSRRFLRELAASGILHYVRRDGQRVAGTCSVRHGDTVWLPVSGVLGGDPVLLQQGVSVAVFSQIFAWAREQGVSRIDAGRTTPFVNDGIPRSKHKWGLRPVPDPLSHLVALRVGTKPALRRAFAAQPVMLETADGLAAYAGE
jgi:hypothetical protein